MCENRECFSRYVNERRNDQSASATHLGTERSKRHEAVSYVIIYSQTFYHSFSITSLSTSQKIQLKPALKAFMWFFSLFFWFSCFHSHFSNMKPQNAHSVVWWKLSWWCIQCVQTHILVFSCFIVFMVLEVSPHSNTEVLSSNCQSVVVFLREIVWRDAVIWDVFLVSVKFWRCEMQQGVSEALHQLSRTDVRHHNTETQTFIHDVALQLRGSVSSTDSADVMV